MKRLLVIAVMAMLTVPDGAEGGAFPGENGRIAFTVVGPPFNQRDVASVEPSGEAQFNLTDDGISSHPAWSPDGTRIAFARGTDVYTMDEYGHDKQLVLDWDATVGDLDWSPDGARLVAELPNCAEFDCAPDIYVFGLDGSGLTNLTSEFFDDHHPSWSPDGTKIAFDSAQSGDQDVYTIEPDGTGLTNVTAGDPAYATDPDWSPDGTQLIYDGAVFSPDGTARAWNGITTTEHPSGITSPPNNTQHREPDWQPRPTYPEPPVAEATFPRPRGATPLRVPLVDTFAPCGSPTRMPNRTHGAPLSYPSCAPPITGSFRLVLGTPDANGFSAAGVGSVTLRVKVGNPSTPGNQADVRLEVSQTDVRANLVAGRPDYTGELLAELPLRVTDMFNSDGPGGAATVMDFRLRAVVPCADNGDPNDGGACDTSTTANALAAGAVRESRRAIWELGQVRVFDGGADGVALTEPNAQFLKQGLFVP
jgi:hypothetical protein